LGSGAVLEIAGEGVAGGRILSPVLSSGLRRLNSYKMELKIYIVYHPDNKNVWQRLLCLYSNIYSKFEIKFTHRREKLSQ